jgi:hypothetical protein
MDTWEVTKGKAVLSKLVCLETHRHTKEFWECHRTFAAEKIPVCASLHVFKVGIQPAYEVPANRTGGHFKLGATSAESANRIWLQINQSMIQGEIPNAADVNGITLLKKQRAQYSVKIWIRNSLDKQHVEAVRNFLLAGFDRSHFSTIKFCPHKYILQTLLHQKKVSASERPRQRQTEGSLGRQNSEDQPSNVNVPNVDTAQKAQAQKEWPGFELDADAALDSPTKETSANGQHVFKCPAPSSMADRIANTVDIQQQLLDLNNKQQLLTNHLQQQLDHLHSQVKDNQQANILQQQMLLQSQLNQVQSQLEGLQIQIPAVKPPSEAPVQHPMQLQSQLNQVQSQLQGLQRQPREVKMAFKAPVQHPMQLQSQLNQVQSQLEGLRGPVQHPMQLQSQLNQVQSQLEGLHSAKIPVEAPMDSFAAQPQYAMGNMAPLASPLPRQHHAKQVPEKMQPVTDISEPMLGFNAFDGLRKPSTPMAEAGLFGVDFIESLMREFGGQLGPEPDMQRPQKVSMASPKSLWNTGDSRCAW